MKYRLLGRSGLKVSRVCLGTMNFGQKHWGCDKTTSLRIVNEFLDAGGNFIDAADIYAKGISEKYLGEAIMKSKRDSVILATKCYFRMSDDPNDAGLSRKHIFDACEKSLRRLKTDYIDLYQIHGPDPLTQIEETLCALDDLVRQGKVRYTGCSNLHAWRIMKAVAVSDRLGLTRFISSQNLYNLIMRDIEREILPVCGEEGIGVTCWSPLASGMLVGKYYREKEPPPDSRISHRSRFDVPRYWHERGFKIVKEVLKISKESGFTPVQISLGWLLHDSRITSVIIGSRNVKQLKVNMTVADWDLPDDLWERLDMAATFNLGYPDSWLDEAKKQVILSSYEL